MELRTRRPQKMDLPWCKKNQKTNIQHLRPAPTLACDNLNAVVAVQLLGDSHDQNHLVVVADESISDSQIQAGRHVSAAFVGPVGLCWSRVQIRDDGSEIMEKCTTKNVI